MSAARKPNAASIERGNAAFRKVFARHSHPDDWGVQCVYDYSAWRIWKAAIRYERKRLAAGRRGR
jgi:hypothetical protein